MWIEVLMSSGVLRARRFMAGSAKPRLKPLAIIAGWSDNF